VSERRKVSKLVWRTLLGVTMTIAGVVHFVMPEPYLKIMPDYLPWHLELVYVSGAFEIAGGIGLFVPKLRSLAGWGIVALLFAVWPANIWQATHGGMDAMSPIVAWVRVAMQPLLIWLAYWVSRPDTRS
jgi:uncharacterized membrane protein